MWEAKKYVSTIVLVLLSLICTSQNTAIPDPNFEQALIDLGYDASPINGFIPTTNINGITNLNVAEKNITSLVGIEDFTALLTLDCSVNLLTSLDVSKNTNLRELYFFDNQIASINITNLANLVILWCYENLLTNLNITQNQNLISVVCWGNNLNSLNTSNNAKLTVLVCDNNNINTLDISKNILLNRFECADNLLSNLDISNNTNLTYFSCGFNELTSLNLNSNKLLNAFFCQFNNLSVLNLSQNTALTQLDCSNNQLCQLNIKNGNNVNATVNFSGNINLNCVVVDNPANTQNNWAPFGFTNYVTSQNQCNNFVNVDTINSVITNTQYTLPSLAYGNYFTKPNGTGVPLFAGDIIASSQIIYIYNESFCASNESSFSILITDKDYYIPKYFTPNNDGIHDVWKVQDFTNTIKNISIFDRHGKLLKYLSSTSQSWNGTSNGNLFVSDTYWYVINLKNGETFNGYFTLKR